jgi:imidazoleglycerol phosphate synthase glutamine amidotransferase subunit HisH
MALSLKVLEAKGYKQALRDYIAADRPFFGICLGMQTLFEGSEECPGVQVRFGRYRGNNKCIGWSHKMSRLHSYYGLGSRMYLTP